MPLLTQWSTCRFMRPGSLFCVLFPPRNNIAYQQNVKATQQRFCLKSTSMIPLRIARTLLHEVAKALKQEPHVHVTSGLIPLILRLHVFNFCNVHKCITIKFCQGIIFFMMNIDPFSTTVKVHYVTTFVAYLL